MTSLAADLDHVYRLDDGTITAYLQADLARVVETLKPTPEPFVQIAASRTAVFGLTATGNVYTRLSVERGGWRRIEAPPDTTWISTDDEYVYALSGGIRQRLLVGGSFGEAEPVSLFTTLVQIDHDEALVYALTDDGRVLTRLADGGWREYLHLGGVVEVVGARDRVYARTRDGDVHRSHVFGRGGWERLGITGARALAIDADHTDELYVAVGGSLKSYGAYSWNGDNVQRAYVADNYAADWATTSPEGQV